MTDIFIGLRDLTWGNRKCELPNPTGLLQNHFPDCHATRAFHSSLFATLIASFSTTKLKTVQK
jgi:hypothetical protein